MSKVYKKNTIATTLTELGLGENEAQLYEILLQNSQATIPLLKQKSPFSRTMLYYVLNNLEGYGLVTTDKQGKKTVYNAAPPEKLEEFMVSQQKELERQKSLLKEVIGDLQSVYRLSHHKPGVRFFEGKEGLVNAYDEVLDLRQPILSIEDRGNMLDFFPDYVEEFVKKRIARKISNRAIAPDTNTINTPDPERHIDSRLIPASEFPFSMDIKICADTVQIATLEEGQAMAVHIVHPLIAENFRVLFEYIWRQADKSKRQTNSPKESGTSSSGVKE